MRRLAMVSAIVVSLAGLTRPGLAQDVRVLDRAGGWTALGGIADNGSPVCGIDTRNDIGMSFLIIYYQNDAFLTVRIFRRTWDIPADARVRVNINIEGVRWTAIADPIRSGRQTTRTGLQFTIHVDEMNAFERAFRQAMRMQIEFPQGSEPPWNFNLTGTNRIMTSFVRCMEIMRDTSRPTQPHSPPRQAPTQPFSQPSPAPSQPFPQPERSAPVPAGRPDMRT